MSDELLNLTAAAAGRAHRGRRDLGAPRSSSSGATARRRDDLGAYLWVAEETPADAGTLPPIAVKDLFCVEGVPSMAGSRILEGYRPPYTATSVRNLQAAGARVLGKTNQDEFAMGSSNENSGYGPVQNPWDRDARAGRVERRQRRGRRRRHGALGDRHRHRRLDPPAGVAVRDRRDEAHLRRGQPLRDDRLRVLARPVRAAHPRRDRRRDPARHLQGRDPCDSTSLGIPGESSCRAPSGSTASASASGGWRRPGLEPGVADAVNATLAKIEELGGETSRRSSCRTPGTGSPPTT